MMKLACHMSCAIPVTVFPFLFLCIRYNSRTLSQQTVVLQQKPPLPLPPLTAVEPLPAVRPPLAEPLHAEGDDHRYCLPGQHFRRGSHVTRTASLCNTCSGNRYSTGSGKWRHHSVDRCLANQDTRCSIWHWVGYWHGQQEAKNNWMAPQTETWREDRGCI